MTIDKRNQLFRLISAMSPSEKAYFKKFGYKADLADSVVFDLFIMIEKLLNDGAIDETILKKRFDKKFPNKDYTKIKSRLLNMLYDSTVNYDAHESELHEIFHLIELSESLFKRKLINDAIYVLNKAGDIAEELEEIELQLKITERLSNLEMYAKVFKREELGFSNYSDKAFMLQIISNRTKVRDATMQVNQFQKIIGTPRSEDDFRILSKISELPGMNIDFSALDLNSKIDQTLSFCILHFSQGKTQNVIQICEQFLNQYVHSNKRPKLFVSKLLALYDAYMQACLIAKETDKLNEALQQLDSVKLKSVENERLKNGIILLVKAISGTKNQGNFNFKTLNEDFTRIEHDDLIPNYRKVSIAYYIILGLFIESNFAEAKSRIAWLYQNPEFNIRYDIEIAIRVMNLIILLEENDWFHLEYAIRNFQQMLESRERNFELEHVFLKMLKKALRSNDSSEFLSILLDAESKIRPLLKRKPSESAFLSGFDLLSWIESKISGRPFKEIIWS